MKKKLILIIEDEQSLAKLVKSNLESTDKYSVVIASAGKEGLDKVKEHIPDLILLDLMLPDIPGEEVCKEIRRNPLIADIPVIMVTAKSLDVDRIIGKVVGANYYMTKPFSSDELLQQIDKLLEGDNL
ncbi:MAG TPA: response regulator [Candidatus Omnitrophica bacterium]|nr:response regulator [Candidatus Omnitrophota bacterium]